MNRIAFTTILAAAAALAACDQSDHNLTATGPDDPQANAVANAAPVTLPPPIAASKTYRCKDNSLLYIDWYADGSARVKTGPSDAGTAIPAPLPDATEPPAITGSASSPTVSYGGKSCKG